MSTDSEDEKFDVEKLVLNAKDPLRLAKENAALGLDTVSAPVIREDNENETMDAEELIFYAADPLRLTKEKTALGLDINSTPGISNEELISSDNDPLRLNPQEVIYDSIRDRDIEVDNEDDKSSQQSEEINRDQCHDDASMIDAACIVAPQGQHMEQEVVTPKIETRRRPWWRRHIWGIVITIGLFFVAILAVILVSESISPDDIPADVPTTLPNFPSISPSQFQVYMFSKYYSIQRREISIFSDDIDVADLDNVGIPSGIGFLTELRRIQIIISTKNNYAGSMLPSEIGLLTKLTELEIAFNLTGSIPTEIFELSLLKVLDIRQASLTGQIPSEIGRLTQLRHFHLRDCKSLNGTIPIEIGHMTKLDSLSLANNLFTGSIPSIIFNLLQLKYLNLAQNSLIGKIPSDIGLLVKTSRLNLLDNLLTGMIPSEIGLLSKAIYLDLRDNLLTGMIPSEIGQLTALTLLSLGENSFEGGIPSEIGYLTQLTYMNLYNSSLTGIIPSEMGCQVFNRSWESGARAFVDFRLNQLIGSAPSCLELLSCNRDNVNSYYVEDQKNCQY